MQEYPVKRTHIKALKENYIQKLTEVFGVDPKVTDNVYRISFGSLEWMDVRLGEAAKSIIVATESKKGIEDETIILDTNRKFRKYLDEVTGYTTKERVKKAKTVE